MLFFGLLFFPFCGSTLLDYSRWSRLRPGEVAPKYSALLGRRDSDPLLCGFFLLLVFVLGHRGPRAYLFAGATVVLPRGSHTHGFFPQVSLYIYTYIHIYMPVGPFAAAIFSFFGDGKVVHAEHLCSLKFFLGPKRPTNLTFKPKMNQ